MKYPTEEDLDRDLTTEEVARLEREYLNMRIEEMKKVKETTIGRAKVNRAPENSVHEDNEEKLAEYIIVDSLPSPSKRPSPTPSVEVLSDVEEPGLPIPSHYVFIPLGMKIRRWLAPIFGINQMGPLPNYTGILRICEGLPSRVQEIEGNGNCLFNSISYVLSSYEKFNWKI